MELFGVAVRPEAALCVFCARNDPRAGFVPSNGLDWQLALRYAQRHGVLQFLSRAVGEGAIQPPPQWRTLLVTQNIRNTALAMLQDSQCQRVLEELRREGTPAVAFKGTVLARLLYGRVVDRVSADIDILVPRARVHDALGVLERLGYRPPVANSPSVPMSAFFASGNELGLVNDAGIMIELHWRLFDEYRACGFGVYFEDLHLNGGEISPEDHFLILAIHGLSHRWEYLKWIVDIDAFVRNVDTDWNAVFVRAEASGTLRAAQVALLLSQLIFDTPVCAWADQRPAMRLARRYARAVLSDAQVTSVQDFFMQARARERWVDRARFLRFVASPKPWDHATSALRLRRVLRLLVRNFRKRPLADVQIIPELESRSDAREP